MQVVAQWLHNAVLYLNPLFIAVHGSAVAQVVGIIVLIFQVIYWIWGLIEIVTMLFDDKSRSLPDYIAGTIVVRE